MTRIAELSYFLAGLVAIIGALRVYYQVVRTDGTAIKATVFSTVGFSLSFLALGVIAS